MWNSKQITRPKGNDCRDLRYRLAESLGAKMSLDSPWVQRHLAQCARCRQRLSGYGRLTVALTLIKSQPHSPELLSRANTQALGRLCHSLRHSSRADKLRSVRVDLALWRRLLNASHSVANIAACLVIFLAIRTGVMCSMSELQKQGDQAVRKYYVHHLGDELAEEVFHT